MTVHSLARAAALGLLLSTPAQAASDAQSAARAEFKAAYESPVLGEALDSAALRDYPLYPWLLAARLKLALAAQAPEAEARSRRFLAEQGDAPAGRELRRLLLTQLAERAESGAFLALYRDEQADAKLRCQWYAARIATRDTTGLAGVLAQSWSAAEAAPAACDSAYAWLQSQPAFTAALIEQRLHARLLQGDAESVRSLPALLPAAARAKWQAMLRLTNSPSGEWPALLRAAPELVDADLAVLTLQNVARKDPDAGAVLLRQLEESCASAAGGAVCAEPLRRRLREAQALAYAWSRRPETLAAFLTAGSSSADERVHEWRLRTALWAGDWAQALVWSEALPRALAQQPRWRYWRARALDEAGRSAEAKALYGPLSRELDNYALFSAWRLGQAWQPPDQPAPVTAEMRLARDAEPAFVRAGEAWQLELKNIASLEWRAAYEALPAAARPALIEAASAWGWHDQALVTATRLGLYGDLRALFPQPYREQVLAAKDSSGIPASWLWAVMRKESAYKADAVSSAGAIGLLQMLPGTAAITARQAGRPAPSAAALADPAINLPLGALHLSKVLELCKGRWPEALAAYNAGLRAVQRWRPLQTMDADAWIENIPYNETRTYVQRILLHVAVYQWLASGKPVRANSWLPPVAPGDLAP